MIDLESVFDEHEEEFLKFERVEEKLHPRPDLCAFLLLSKLVPGDRNLIDSAEHDEISLSIDCKELAKAATEEDVKTLVRCGVGYDQDEGYLKMFV